MEKKPVANPNKKQRAALGSYFKGVKTEIKKVVWPTKKEMGSYTTVVILACTFFALLFWGFDSAFLAVLRAVLNISI